MGEGKLNDIRETASDAAEIMRQLGTPAVRESLDKAKEITDTVKEIMEILRTPEWVRNIENINKISEKIPDFSSTSGGNMKGFIESAKKVMYNLAKDEGGLKGQDLKALATSIKEMMQSFRELADELTAVAAESNMSGSLRDAKKTSSSLSSAYKAASGA